MTEEEVMAEAAVAPEEVQEKKPSRRPSRPTAGPKDPRKMTKKKPELKPDPEVVEEIKKVKEEEPKAEVKPVDILIWVGRREHATIDDFEELAWKKGIIDKISKAPKNFVPGKSRVFLAHDEGNAGDAVIFGYYVPKTVQLVIDEAGQPGQRKRKVPRYVKKVKARSYPPGTMLLNLHKPDEETLVIFSYGETRDYNHLIDASAKRFRGFKVVDGDAIIASPSTKTNPKERLTDKYQIDLQKNPLPHQRWTVEEDEVLLKLIEQTRTKAEAFQMFAEQTDRTELSVSYHYYRLRDKMNKEGSPTEEA